MKQKKWLLLPALALALCLVACGGGKDAETEANTAESSIESVTETTPVAESETTAGEGAESETAPESEGVSETAGDVETNPETNPEDISETESETISETESETIPETVPETLPELLPETYDAALDNSVVDTTLEHVVDQSQWIVTDGLDRVMVTHTQTGDLRDKEVAIFYWTWHGDFANQGQKAYNNQENIDKLIAMGKTERDYVTASIGDLNKWGIKTASGPYHFWDEPIYGYYSANDEWVLRKQAELLAAADVDVVFFDNTNGTFTWMESAKRVMKVFSEARKEGVDAPYVSFMLPFGQGNDTNTQLVQLYNQIYKQDYYSDIWYRRDGKPMIMAHAGGLNTGDATQKAISEFFTFRANVADYLQQETAPGKQWGWLSRFPQAYFHDSEGNIEQITVGTAINHDYVNSVIAPMSLGQNVIGRTWTSRGYDTRENAVFYGACFAEQWENALAVDPELVFVTAWNEWVAMRIGHWPAASGYSNCFVDQYNAEFSRDCEPSAGILKDYYYYQLADYIRQFKGTNPIEKASDPKLMDVNGGYGQWANVGPVYNDYFGLPDRNSYGYTDPNTGKRLHYTNDTGRNDVYDAKVARDYENIYFMVRTVEDLTPYTDAEWMTLYIDLGEVEGGNWENYEFILNKQNPENETTATLEKFTGNGYETEVVGKVSYSVQGNVLTVCIPKTMLGIDADEMDFAFGFKWTDNTLVGEDGDIMKWYVNGDVAPVGRFNYCYTTTGSAEYVEKEDKGNYTLDFTDADTQTMVKEYLIGESTAGVDYEFTAEGLKFTSTAAGNDATMVLEYKSLTPQVLADRCTEVKITYRVLTDATELRFGVSCGATKVFEPKRARKLTVVADGEVHTATVETSALRISDGYVNMVGFTFPSDTAAGQTVIIEKIEFVTGTAEATE